jgi:uncharacterized protein YjiS (DUF1127 family)
MTLLASAYAKPDRPAFLTRIIAWFAARSTRKQRRTTIDLLSASPHLQRDLGLDRLTFTERRW